MQRRICTTFALFARRTPTAVILSVAKDLVGVSVRFPELREGLNQILSAAKDDRKCNVVLQVRGVTLLNKGNGELIQLAIPYVVSVMICASAPHRSLVTGHSSRHRAELDH